MSGTKNSARLVLGVIGAIAGGAIGYFAFFFIAQQGFYAMVLPGAILGLGCGWLSGIKSNLLGVVCAISAVCLGLFTEWRYAPFLADDSLAYFMTHLQELKPITLIMIGFGGLFGYWFGMGRDGGVGKRSVKHKPSEREMR